MVRLGLVAVLIQGAIIMGGKKKPKKARHLPEGPNNTQTSSSPNNAKDSRQNGQNQAELGECVVVGIGASAGGLDAFKRFLRHMPDDAGMAYGGPLG